MLLFCSIEGAGDLFTASVDPIEKAKETAEKLKITFPTAYGLNAERVS